MEHTTNINDVLNRMEEYRAAARKILNPVCHVCKTCDGIACSGHNTNALEFGGKGNNGGFLAAVRGLASKAIELDPIHEDYEPDTSCSFFGHSFDLPVFASPIGKLLTHATIDSPFFNNNEKYAEALLKGCYRVGGMAWLGDNKQPGYFEGQIEAIRELKGVGVPTIKPWWDRAEIMRRIELSKEVGAMAVATDLDAIGLGYQYSGAVGEKTGTVCAHSEKELRSIIRDAGVPVLIKGILSVKAAQKARDAGAAGILISNHGGNVVESSLAPCDVVADIRKALGRDLLIFADGGVRSGEDVFKMLALGADAVGIGRPYAVAVYGGGEDGAAVYTQKIYWELKNIMRLANCRSLSEITMDKLCAK